MIRTITYIHPETREAVSVTQVRSRLEELGRKQFLEQREITTTRVLELNYPSQTRSVHAHELAVQLSREKDCRLLPV